MRGLYTYSKAIRIGAVLVLILTILVVTDLAITRKVISPSSPSNRGSTLPTALPTQADRESSKEYATSLKRIEPTESVLMNQEEKVSFLLSLLPYRGSYMTLTYDKRTYSFVLTLDKNNTTKGQMEFDAFLTQHGVASRTWIHYLTIQTAP